MFILFSALWFVMFFFLDVFGYVLAQVFRSSHKVLLNPLTLFLQKVENYFSPFFSLLEWGWKALTELAVNVFC